MPYTIYDLAMGDRQFHDPLLEQAMPVPTKAPRDAPVLDVMQGPSQMSTCVFIVAIEICSPGLPQKDGRGTVRTPVMCHPEPFGRTSSYKHGIPIGLDRPVHDHLLIVLWDAELLADGPCDCSVALPLHSSEKIHWI